MAGICRTLKLLANIHSSLHSELLFTANICSKRWIRRLAVSEEHILNPKIAVSSQSQDIQNTLNSEAVTDLTSLKNNVSGKENKRNGCNDSEIRTSGQDYFKDWIKTIHSDQKAVVNHDQSTTLQETREPNMCQEESSIVSSKESLAVSLEKDPLVSSEPKEGKKYILQNLIELGIDISIFREETVLRNTLKKMDFEQEIKPIISFLHNQGVSLNKMGNIITKCPGLLQEDLANLEVRINYLLSKQFNKEAIAYMINKEPNMFRFPTQKIDSKLGFYQKEFNLSGDELRGIITRLPKLVRSNQRTIREIHATMRKQLGFSKQQIKEMIIVKPKLLIITKKALLDRFEYLHQVLLLDHDKILEFPAALLIRRLDVKQRHLFLKTLGQDQFDPTKENFISLHSLVTGSDKDFCSIVAKVPIQKFTDFQKTLL